MALGLADGGCTGALLPAPLVGILTIILRIEDLGSGIELRAAPQFNSIRFDSIFTATFHVAHTEQTKKRKRSRSRERVRERGGERSETRT